MTDRHNPLPLLPLPEPHVTLQIRNGRPVLGAYMNLPMTPLYTAEQMHAYARANLATRDAEIKRLQDALAQAHKDFGFELRDPNGTIWQHAANMQEELKSLRALVEYLRMQITGPSTVEEPEKMVSLWGAITPDLRGISYSVAALIIERDYCRQACIEMEGKLYPTTTEGG